MSKHDFTGNYINYVEYMKATRPHDQAMKDAVGSNFEWVSELELALLRMEGLTPDDYVIDVGCGSGRLLAAFTKYSKGRFLGTDVVPELLAYAVEHYARPDWRFELTDGLSIPEEDAQADYVCFFSVFTHLLDEESFANLVEALRVLKPGGKVLFSFLEFGIHWPIFEANVGALIEGAMLNTFIDRASLSIWAEKLGLDAPTFYDGDKNCIPLPSGESASFGQSVCVMTKRA